MKKALIWINNNLKDKDIVFVANSSAFENFFNKDFNSNNSNKFNDFYYSSNRLNYLKDYVNKLDNFSRIFEKNQKFYFLISPPQFSNVRDAYCIQEWFRPSWIIKKECFINYKEIQNKQKFFEKIVLNNLSKLKTFKVDLKYLCNSKKCSAYGYYDSSHLLDDFALMVIKNSNFGISISDFSKKN